MSEYQPDQLRNIIEAALLVATRPMSLSQLEGVFEHEDNPPDKPAIRNALGELQEQYESRGIELVEVASGWRMQTRESMSPWITNLFQEKAPRYSRALLETLVLIAYRQPITRGEIEDVRGVAVSSNIVRTLIERDWVKIVGHRDVPGRPALLGTTKQFLDYFNLKKIGELPTLSEIKALDEIAPELAQEVAMLDQTIASDEENGELESVDAGDAESDELSVSDATVSESESEQLEDESEVMLREAADESQIVDSEDEDFVTGAESVDVELALEDDLEEPDESLSVSEEAVVVVADESLEAETEVADDAEDEVVAVSEATIDAMSSAPRPETELLH